MKLLKQEEQREDLFARAEGAEEWKSGGEGGRGEAGVGDVARAVPLASGATPVALTVRSQA